MKKGIIVLRPPFSTGELRSQVTDMLINAGWVCEHKTRFDGVLAVNFESIDNGPESTVDELREYFGTNPLLTGVVYDIKELG